MHIVPCLEGGESFLTHATELSQISAISSIGAELVGFRAEAPNSVAFGTFACSLLSIMMACLILLDLNKLYTDCKMMKTNVSSLLNKNNKVSNSSAGLQESTA